MSKKNTPQSAAAGEAETTTAETTERAATGSSIAAQCKQLVLAASEELTKAGGLYADTVEWLHRAANEIRSKTSRGLSPADKLLKLNDELTAAYESVEVVDGRPRMTAEQIKTVGELTVKINRLEARIANAAEKAETTTA